MNRGLLSGLTKAEKRPYEGWKTNSFVERSGSPENDDVCLLEDDCTTVDVEDSPKSMKCLSDGNKNPWDYNSKDSSYKIPKRTDSSDEQETKGVTWFKSSFPEKDNLPQRNFRTRSAIERQRNHTNRITQKKEIGYRMLRQAGPSCATRQWKHTSAPGWLSRCQREKTVCKAPETKCNGAVPMNNTEQNAQRTSSALKEGYDRSLLDSILQGNTVSKDNLSNGENSRSNSTSSDTNFRMKMSITPLLDSPTSSKDVLSDDNYDDAFADHCDKCTSRLSRDKSCPSCEKDIFPSQAATPRRPLSPDRFYSADGQKPKVQRTYNKTRGNGARVLLMGNAAKSTDTKTSVGSCPTTSRLKRRKNQGKSNSDSDSDYTPGKKRNGKQLKLTLPKKVDVITLSDEEEVEETTAALVVEEGSQCDTSAAGSNSFNLLPESPNSAEEGCGKGEVKFDSINAEECSETSAKRKTPPSKEKQPAKKKSNNLHGYTRDDLEIEIMVRQDIRIGTLACTATDPLKITCKTDEIKLSVDYGKKNLLLTITGNDLTSFKLRISVDRLLNNRAQMNSWCQRFNMPQISHGLNPDVIVLGVTPGYALKLAQKIPNQGKFLNPGSAVAAERDIVLEVSEHVKTEVIADLMEWVTDKLSKEFGELSLKEVERIKAFKTPTSTSKEQNQSANEATSTLMTTRSRTYNTRSNSCIRPVQNAQRLVVFPPPPQPGGITVTSEDIPCLDAGEFLNDVIIDFYLKFVFFEKLKPEDRARTHILSSFFYKRLTQRSTNNSDTFSSPPDRMHSQVKTWTKNVDIFEKDFVFVPINESSHWYLAVICFAGHTRATYINEIADEDDETNSKNKDPDVDTTIEKKSENDDDDEKDGSDNDDDDFELTSLATLQSTSTKRNTRKRKSLPKQTIRSQPCILVFDSLGGQRQRCMTNLRNYLKVEWRERKKDAETRDFNKDNIKGSHPKVPQQDNFCDCGVYVLQYMESFFEDPITDFSLPIRKDDWFSREIITEKRNDIRHVIFGLKVAAETENS